jgi:hypothetical protein
MVLPMVRDTGIYVEILISGDVDEIWQRTQVPELHELWDLRFTGIQYLPKQSEDEPQRFLYSTRIGFGLSIDGEGESTGTKEDAMGVRTSALKFWSSDAKSLIEEGSGYWSYVPTENGTRFLTWYDYRTRFGAAGGLIDRVFFRPLIGWATAWSFDRLRLWIERGILPQVSFRFALIHAFARLGIAFIWLWQGLMPKLLFPSRDEVAMLDAVGLPIDSLVFIGVFELILAVVALALWRWRGFFLLNALAMIVALATVALSSPAYLVTAFNPVTLNTATLVLSLIGYFAAVDLPSASRCLRKPTGESK